MHYLNKIAHPRRKGFPGDQLQEILAGLTKGYIPMGVETAIKLGIKS